MRREPTGDYTHESLVREREYGLYWYSWLWGILRPVLIIACAALLLIGGLSFAWRQVSGALIDPVNPGDAAAVTFVVAPGDSLTRVSNNLQNQNLIRNRSVFKYYADFMGFGQKIQAGEYTLSRGMTIGDIAERLTRGDGKPIARTVTVIPGWTVETTANYLVREGFIKDRNEFLQRARTGQDYGAWYYIADVLASGNVPQRRYALEGYLSPDTYEVFTDATADDIIRKLLSQTEAVFTQAYHERAEEMGMTLDEVITMASMIEKEARNADFAKVSAVFHGRLRQNMYLGSDVTIKYATGTSRMALTRADLAVDTPFNTYTHRGLPPGPICSPSPAAIRAALYPDEAFLRDGYLYFCSKDPDTGELHFSRTLQEHEAAVRIYSPLWEAFDRRTNAQ